MSKQVNISARISLEDAEFISSLNIGDAKTPSDKLRALIGEARQRSARGSDYPGVLHATQDMIQPSSRKIKHLEVENQIHSELIVRVAEWLPDTIAYLVSAIAEIDDDRVKEKMLLTEKGVAVRLARLLESFLQLAITKNCACYDPSIINQHIDSILELSQIIVARQRQDEGGAH